MEMTIEEAKRMGRLIEEFTYSHMSMKDVLSQYRTQDVLDEILSEYTIEEVLSMLKPKAVKAYLKGLDKKSKI